MCCSAFAASDHMIPSFPSSFVSLFTVLLEYSFAFYFHSLLVVLIWTCPFCRRTFGVWGGEEACYHSKYFPFLHFIPSFTLTAPLLMAVKPPGVKDSILAPAVGTALKAGLFLSLLCDVTLHQTVFRWISEDLFLY